MSVSVETIRRQRERAIGSLVTQFAPPLDLPFRFMLVAVLGCAVVAGVSLWATPLLVGSFNSPGLLIFVHLNTLGVLAATIFGASYQLGPVVLQSPLLSTRLARLSWWLYVPGLLALLGGFATGMAALLASGASLLLLAVGLYVATLVGALARAPVRDVVFWHLAAALVSLTLAAALGVVLAANKHTGLLGGTTFPALAAHAVLMLGGWITPMITGVAYRLIAMFTLTEDRLRADWAVTEFALTVGGAWLLAASFLASLPGPVRLVGAGAVLAGLLVFDAQALRLYYLRRRRSFDIHVPYALTGMGFGTLAAALLVAGVAGDRPLTDPLWTAVGWLAIMGWAETVVQGFLYKIGPFLTWLHRYARRAGQQPVPKLEDLFDRRTALVGWVGWTCGVAWGTGAALGQAPALAHAAGVALAIGAGAFVLNAVRVGRHWREPC